MKYIEYKLQCAVCNYIRLQYPNVYFLSDTVASLKLNVMQAARNKAIQNSNFKCPDIIILQPNNGYNGLMIELKIDSPYKKNGEIKANKHLIGQNETLEKLKKIGYDAHFAWNFEMAKKLIDKYLK